MPGEPSEAKRICHILFDPSFQLISFPSVSDQPTNKQKIVIRNTSHYVLRPFTLHVSLCPTFFFSLSTARGLNIIIKRRSARTLKVIFHLVTVLKFSFSKDSPKCTEQFTLVKTKNCFLFICQFLNKSNTPV